MTDQKTEQKHTPGPWVAIFPDERRYHEGTDITSYEVMTEKTRKQMRDEGREHYSRHHEDVANLSVLQTTFWQDMKDEEAKANARLIAAAPELLGALIEASEWVSEYVSQMSAYTISDEADKSLRRVRAAIAKATGGVRHD